MSSAWIKTRVTKSGKRYLVYYRRGGRYTLQEYAGSFKTVADARERKRLVDTELAAGRDPALVIKALAAPRSTARTLEQWWNAFIAARVDVGAKAQGLYRNARDRICTTIGDRDPATLTPADIQTVIGTLDDLAAKTVEHYVSTLRQVLDFADVEPNPARSPKVRLPVHVAEEIRVLETRDWNALRDQVVSDAMLLALRLMECCGTRIGETTQLTYGDVDFANGRLRISRARTKARTAGQRWIPAPDALLDEIAELCPLEDRHRDRRVFGTLTEDRLRRGFARALRDAGLSDYSPHDLRHRRISLWFSHGFDPITISRWAGHSRASISSDVYGHVVVSSDDEWRSFWLAQYDRARRPKAQDEPERGAPVGHEEGDTA